MSDDEKLNKQITRGARATALLNDELLSEAFTTLHDEYIKAWAATHPSETQAREHFYRAVQILGDVRKHLRAVAASGRVAQKELDQLSGLNRIR